MELEAGEGASAATPRFVRAPPELSDPRRLEAPGLEGAIRGVQRGAAVGIEAKAGGGGTADFLFRDLHHLPIDAGGHADRPLDRAQVGGERALERAVIQGVEGSQGREHRRDRSAFFLLA